MVRIVRGRLVLRPGILRAVKQTSILKVFGAHVRKLRLNKGLSQEDLAMNAELDRSYVGGVERGERNISLLNVERLARALDVSLGELFKGLQ